MTPPRANKTRYADDGDPYGIRTRLSLGMCLIPARASEPKSCFDSPGRIQTVMGATPTPIAKHITVTTGKTPTNNEGSDLQVMSLTTRIKIYMVDHKF